MLSPKIRRFLKYTSVGTSTFLFDLLLLFVLIDVFSVGHLWAAGIAFTIAVSINYLVSRRVVFTGTIRSVGSGYLNFMMIAGMGVVIVVSGMYVLVDIYAFHYIVARICIAGISGFWNYLMNLYVNFKVVGKHY